MPKKAPPNSKKTRTNAKRDKKRFWSSIAEMSEDEFRVQIVVPLLRATPGVTNVTEVHGQNERGLDVIFFVESEIERLCYGLQLKAGDIAGGGTGKKTVKQIVDQLQLADDYDHPVATRNAGTYKIDKYVVCTSGAISNTAQEEIARRLKSIPVLFWDGNEIIRRTHRFMPQLFQVADGGAVEYLQAVLMRAESLDALDQIPGVAKRTLSQVFIAPHLRRKFDPSVAAETGAAQSSPSTPAFATLSQHTHVVLISDQDGGKTAVLRMHVIQRIKDLLGGEEGGTELPVLLRAKDILARGLSVRDAIVGELQTTNGGSLASKVDADLSASRYTIAIDGFSEFLREEDKDLVASLIEQFCEKYPNTHVVVAARPVDFLHVKYLPKFYQYTIDGFSSTQVAALVRAWTGDSTTYADVAEKMVDRLREALQLPGSPIPAMIGVMLHEEQGRFITNTAEAIDRYMVIRLGRYAHELGMKQEIDWARKQDLLAEVAFAMVEAEEDTLSKDEFVERFNDIYKRQGEFPLGSLVLDELLDSGVLVSDGERLGFHRTSFRDFFAAHHLVQRGDLERFAIEKLYARQWGGVVVFAAGLRRRNSQLLMLIAAAIESLRSRAIGEPTEDYLYASYTCGRVLSNSDTADHGPRMAALRAFLRGAGDALPDLEALLTEQLGNVGSLVTLIGMEQTVFTTVGVPWLQNQFKELLVDPNLPEEEKYILASTYAHLGYDDAFQVLGKVAKELKSTRALVALDVLVQQLEAKRSPTGEEAGALNTLRATVRRKLAGRKEQLSELLKVKSQALEVERRRLERLMAAGRGD